MSNQHSDQTLPPGRRRVVVCGSRSWRDATAIQQLIDGLPAGSTVIVGGAPGADRLAERAARARNDLKVIVEQADWRVKPDTPRSAIRRQPGASAYDVRAGALRNRRMLDHQPDRVVAFQQQSSTGTQDTINEARRRGIPTTIITDP